EDLRLIALGVVGGLAVAGLGLLLFWRTSRIARVPAWVWFLLAGVSALAVPHEVDLLALPDEPVFAKVRAGALRQLVVQCEGSAVFLVLGVVRWAVGARSEQGPERRPEGGLME